MCVTGRTWAYLACPAIERQALAPSLPEASHSPAFTLDVLVLCCIRVAAAVAHSIVLAEILVGLCVAGGWAPIAWSGECRGVLGVGPTLLRAPCLKWAGARSGPIVWARSVCGSRPLPHGRHANLGSSCSHEPGTGFAPIHGVCGNDRRMARCFRRIMGGRHPSQIHARQGLRD